MSLFSSISLMSSALRTFDRAVRVTSNNIANSETVGFTRRRVNLAENLFAITDGLSLGSGVGVSSISRMRDRFLDVQIRAQASQVGYYDALSRSMEELKAIFPDVVDPSSTVGIAGRL
ncbi:MAG: flagellar basal body protein, partial [candidate division FCPU426 bacterium]